jgi:hypothetical protein
MTCSSDLKFLLEAINRNWIMKSEDVCVFCKLVSLEMGISLHLLGLPLADLAFGSYPEAWGILSLGAV